MAALNVKGLLFDLDGVLYIDSQPIPGAIDAIANIRARGLPCRFITNTSTLSLASLQNKLAKLGFDIPAQEIISAPQAALLYLRQQRDPVCRLLLAEDVREDFMEFRQSDTEAQYIVIGDIGNAWNYDLMNEVFNCLMRGASLIAIHKNRFWQTEQGLRMDIGGFVQALEYASGCGTMLIGKPSADFFHAALDDLGLPPSEVAVIGDDIDTDVGGAQQAGMKGVLVRTGKYRQNYVDASAIQPDMVLNSIVDLPAALGF